MKKKSLLLTAVATLGLTAATMAQSVPGYVPTNGLVGWWCSLTLFQTTHKYNNLIIHFIN
jgi:hypothetical protein